MPVVRPTRALVVTSINAPNAALRALAAGSVAHGIEFLVVGDARSPSFALEDSRFLDLRAQLDSGLTMAAACPVGHYARKNIGYLEAIRLGAETIVETDDDNVPAPAFFAPRTRVVTAPSADRGGWVNVYRYFGSAAIWPRGFPLDLVSRPVSPLDGLPVAPRDCPIQQGLVSENPDVDAVCRMLVPLPQSFDGHPPVALGDGSWCPFNSQNTTWWPDAYPLLYLPAYCTFRVTDIWRSFVAQRIAWAQGWRVLFHAPTVRHDRNDHDPMRDFEDEVPGYLHNRRIVEALDGLSITPGLAAIPQALRRSYETLVRLGHFPKEELALLECWLADLETLRPRPSLLP